MPDEKKVTYEMLEKELLELFQHSNRICPQSESIKNNCYCNLEQKRNKAKEIFAQLKENKGK